VGALYLIFAGLYLNGLLVRDVYETLKKAGRIDTADKRVFGVVFSSMIVMWVSWFAMGFLDPVRLPVPGTLRMIGLGAVVVGFGMAIGGMWQLKGVENIDHLVTTGLFSRIRHPMYAGFILWILGWSTYQGAATTLALGCLGILSVIWWRRLEETALLSAYGSVYAEYRVRTWF
jgi:protein-S-isoprenylcysteine O-methyltransferase Ste14